MRILWKLVEGEPVTIREPLFVTYGEFLPRAEDLVTFEQVKRQDRGMFRSPKWETERRQYRVVTSHLVISSDMASGQKSGNYPYNTHYGEVFLKC